MTSTAPGTWLTRTGERLPGWLGWSAFVVSAAASLGWYTRPGNGYGVDLDVYREAAEVLFGSDNVYDLSFTESVLPFTYTPFAGLLFQVLRIVPDVAVQTLWAAASIACLFAVVRWALPNSSPQRWSHAALVTAVALWVDPVMNTMSFGQVNLFLMAAIALDLGGRRTRWTGVWVGVATAVKLTPGIFILYLLVSGRHREAFTAIGAAAGCTLIGLAVLPTQTMTFFFGGIGSDPSRVGPQEFIGNQSLHGMFVRWSDAAAWGEIVWLTLAVAFGVLGLVLSRRLELAGHRAMAIVWVGLLGCLVSPVSWTHHFVWVVPMAVLIGYTALPLPRRSLVQVGWVLLFLIHPIWFLPTGRGLEFGYGWWQDLVASAYPVAIVALGLWLLWAWRVERDAETAAGTVAPSSVTSDAP